MMRALAAQGLLAKDSLSASIERGPSRRTAGHPRRAVRHEQASASAVLKSTSKSGSAALKPAVFQMDLASVGQRRARRMERCCAGTPVALENIDESRETWNYGWAREMCRMGATVDRGRWANQNLSASHFRQRDSLRLKARRVADRRPRRTPYAVPTRPGIHY